MPVCGDDGAARGGAAVIIACPGPGEPGPGGASLPAGSTGGTYATVRWVLGMSVPAQGDYGPGPGYGHGPGYGPGHADGWPANELEEVLAAALGDPGATARVVEVLGRSP